MWLVACGLWLDSAWARSNPSLVAIHSKPNSIASFLRPQTTSETPHSFSLSAVGDVMLDRYVGREIDRHGTSYPLARVRALLAKADLVVANLECPLTSRPKELHKTYTFRVPPERVAALKGIDVVSVANNHTLDCGRGGLTDTLAALRGAGIEVCGIDADPLIIERKGIRIGIIAFSDFPETVNGGGPGVNYYNPELMKRKIALAHKTAGFVIVLAHWGIEGDSTPSDRQRREAKELAADGADLILGAHPHVLQPVDRIGKTVVAYSMGNFVFDPPNAKQASTAVFQFEIGNDGVGSSKLIPCRIRHEQPAPS